MTRFPKIFAVVAGVSALLGVSAAHAQLNYGATNSTAGTLLRNFQYNSVGGGAFSAAATNTQILNQSRAFAASNGIGPYQTANSSLSNAPTRPRVPTFGGPRGTSVTKPFDGISRDSTISPYLSLFNETEAGVDTTIDNYNVLVRPQLQQQSTNRALQRQAQQLNTRVQQISAQSAFDASGSERIMATGHQTTFGFYSRFYPALNRRR